MKIRLIAGAVMAVLAVIGIALVVNYAVTADSRALGNQQPREVYLVTAPIVEGTPVEEFGESVTLQTVPEVIVPDGAVIDLGEHRGQVAGVDLQPGEQLLASRLVDPQALEDPGTVPVPKGMQEITIQLEPARVVGGQVEAGDTVGVFVSFEGDEARTSQELHKVLVTSVQGAPAAAAAEGSAEETEPTGNAAPAVPEGSLLVTLAVKADVAEEIVYAQEFARTWLSLENEDAEENDDGATRGDFE
ncbi:MAG: Flp pilus assembly protein CpaB [Actinomycetota bacterium]